MLNVHAAAIQYIAAGWHVVPLLPQSKACIGEADWLTTTYTAEDFTPDSNIGIKSVGGLIDTDCDCGEAVALAAAFLPKTSAIYGRPSRPNSHHLYHCPTITTPLSFKNLIEKTTIIEVRVNHQTMAPPSMHPDGEQITWAEGATCVALEVEEQYYLRMVQLVATGAMIARYYNPPGARHDWGVALAGFLRRLSITQHEAERLFECAATWANDDKVKDRIDAVRTTYAKSDDVKTTGATKLQELIGEQGTAFIASLRKFWGEDVAGVSQSNIDRMNEMHAVIYRQGGKITVMTERNEMVRGETRRLVRYTSRREFGILYPDKVQAGINAKGNPIVKTRAEAWIEHPKRRFYWGVELAPDGRGNKDYYNLWQGFSVEPKHGDWSLYREHLNLLVKGDQDHLQYVLSWMADCVQRPSQPAGIALAFKGIPGTGKSTAAKWFGALFGSHFIHLDSEARLLGNFNAHLHNAIVILADEAVWAGGKAGQGALKRMITEDTLMIEPKGLDIIEVDNMLHMIVASNEDWFVPKGLDDRRFAIFEVSDEKANDNIFFEAVKAQLFTHGGLAALLYDLLHVDLSHVNLRIIPETEEGQRQKQHTMSAKHQWWLEELISGGPWLEATCIPGSDLVEIDPNDLYSQYVVALGMADKRVNAGTKAALSRFLRTILPRYLPRAVQHGGKRYWILPPLDVARQEFDHKTKLQHEWPEDTAPLSEDVPF